MTLLRKQSQSRVVTVRKEHRCYDCDMPIVVGKRALLTECMPNYDFNPRPGHWTTAWFHKRCSDQSPAWQGEEAG